VALDFSLMTAQNSGAVNWLRRQTRYWLNVRFKGSMDGPEGKRSLPWERRMTHAMSLILRFLKDGQVVLLHCKAGKHRSGFEGALTLALIRDLTWDNARQTLFETRGFYECRDKQIITDMGKQLQAQDFIRKFRCTREWGEVRAAFTGDSTPQVFKARGFSCFTAFRCFSTTPHTHRSPGRRGGRNIGQANAGKPPRY